MADKHPLLVAICDPTRLAVETADWAAAVFEGGVDLIQLRAPDLGRDEIEVVARRLIAVAPSPDRIQINRFIDLASGLGTGVHLPERLGTARPPLRPASRSVHSPEAARASSDFDFVLAGHIFATSSKPGLPPRGTDWLAEMALASPVPVVAIGGISVENAHACIAAGASGIAVIGALTASSAPRRDAERLRRAIDAVGKGERMQEKTATIDITLNGKPASVPVESTIHDLLQEKELAERLVVVELNGTIVPRSDFGETRFSAGDLVEIVHFVGGGAISIDR